MFATTLDTLYTVLAISILVFTIFACVGIFYLIVVLRDVAKVTETAREVVERVDRWIIEPVKLINEIRKKIKVVNEFIDEKRTRRKKK